MGKYLDDEPDIWLKYLDDGGSLDIDRMAAENGGVEAIRQMMLRGRFGRSVVAQVQAWLGAQNDREAGDIARRQAEAAEIQAHAATSALKLSRISVVLSVVAVLVAVGGLMAQIWDLMPSASPPTAQASTQAK